MSDDAKLIADTLAAGFDSLNKELEGMKKELDDKEKLDRRIFRVVALFVIVTLPIGAKQLMELADTMSKQMQDMNLNMGDMKDHMASMNESMAAMRKDMGAMQASMSTMDGNMANMTAYINAMTGHVSMMDQGMRVMNGSMVDMDRSMKPMRAMGSMIPGW
ncbi:hypothetical protein [Imhoffiella purpurea]|uniref:Uncharacterized protein n=1 Tax=Imhoffiella purpurea TaxID=1249627 RepID=W9VHA1_9GAMM|nr:hypothetical protein [Imhoffiella purpurea]EXJ15422.1 hypothetical protein D779_1386 [Imhoffiella purpurea]